MSKIVKLFAMLVLVLPVATYAINVGDYFQQAVTVTNESGHDILITDPVSSELQNYDLPNKFFIESVFPRDQFTNPAGQMFTHTVTINSATNFAPLCVVQSNLSVTTGGIKASKPTTSNATHCVTSVYLKSVGNDLVYGFKINVK